MPVPMPVPMRASADEGLEGRGGHRPHHPIAPGGLNPPWKIRADVKVPAKEGKKYVPGHHDAVAVRVRERACGALRCVGSRAEPRGKCVAA